ncbi:unnamed protein product [Paramecium pentaurelia]|uniref:Uncharacterized protein n=1 Tax=Paramecium pentaurelia TaxID=43138 RepID=A0A8S1WM94_9CILI|nr:unnamed protein product [Paramecium pentaurelia]
MQELQEFLDKQKDLNFKMLEDMLSSQSLQIHNLSMGLKSFQHSLENFQQKHRSRNKNLFKLYSNDEANIFIHLEKEIQNLYCKSDFTLSISLRDYSGNLTKNEEYTVYIKLFSADKFPKEITVNSQGKPLLVGKTKLLLKGKGEFKKLQITEQSSNFPLGKFALVLYSNSPDVQSLILENIVVQKKK